MKSSPRILGGLSTIALASTGLLVAAPSASAATLGDGACQQGEGVTMVVQDPDRTIIDCAPGDPANGEDALTSAGFEIRHDASGMICQIGYEGVWFPREEDGWYCGIWNGTYWSYWHADSSQSPWEYSQLGAISYDPDTDEIEGWRYGTGRERPNDGVVPPYAAEPDPEPTTPEPTTPEPTTPEPTTPEPTTPEPTTPEPTTPEPTTPEPTTPEPTTPEPTTPEPTTPEPTTPEPTTPEPTTPEPSPTTTGPVVDTGSSSTPSGLLPWAAMGGLLLAGGAALTARLGRR